MTPDCNGLATSASRAVVVDLLEVPQVRMVPVCSANSSRAEIRRVSVAIGQRSVAPADSQAQVDVAVAASLAVYRVAVADAVALVADPAGSVLALVESAASVLAVPPQVSEAVADLKGAKWSSAIARDAASKACAGL